MAEGICVRVMHSGRIWGCWGRTSRDYRRTSGPCGLIEGTGVLLRRPTTPQHTDEEIVSRSKQLWKFADCMERDQAED